MTLQETRNKIFSAPLRQELLSVPEWGVDVLVQEMNGAARDRFMERSITKTFKHLQPEIVIGCALDPETKQPMFTTADRDNMANLSGAAIGRIAEKALVLSGLAAADFEEATKN